MFDKLHLLSQDVPEGGDGFRWRAHPYLRIAGSVPRGPAVFEWSARQRQDLEALWRDPTSDGPRERLAKDLAAFCDRLGWKPDVKMLEEAEQHGEEYIVTLSAVPPELYILPWEVVQVGAEGRYLSDYASAQVRYAMPGLESRPVPTAPDKPGVLFAWSRAGGEVPSEDHAAAIRGAAEAAGVAYQEVAEVDEINLQAALDAGAPSVLHLLCHGLPGAEGEPSRLSWGAADNPTQITATRLARLLRRYDSAIRLVVLSTCGSGDGYDNPMLLGSLAQELHKKGIRSVVASRYPLSARGSCVMTRSLYDKMLREAWSLERALRFTREVLLRVVEDGETHPGDAYGIQLYAYDTERFVSDNAVEAERPVLATYPFGTGAHPVPASAPPRTELTLVMDADHKLSEDELVAKLRKVAEDDHLTVAIPLDRDHEGCALSVQTTADGAQRLLGAWRSKALHVVIGVAVGRLLVAKGVAGALQGLFSALAGNVGAAAGHLGGVAGPLAGAGKVVVTGGRIGSGKLAVAAGRAAKATSQVGGKLGATAGGAAGQAAATSQAVAAGQMVAAGQVVATGGAGKLAATALAIAGKVVSAKIAVVAVLGTVAVIGGAEVYRAQTQQPAAAAFDADLAEAASPPPPRTRSPAAASQSPLPTEGSAAAPAAPAPPVAIAAAPAAPAAAATASVPAATGRAASPASRSTPGPATTGGPATGFDPSQRAAAAPAVLPAAAVPVGPAAVATTTPVEPASSAPAAPLTPPSRGSGGEPVAAAPLGAASGPGAGSAAAAPPPGAASGSAGATVSPAERVAGAPGGSATATGEPAAVARAEPPAAPAGPVCGNAVVEAGEQCDDGNTRDGDGCSATCTKEAARPVPIAPSALELQRVAGNTDIQPSKQTRSTMIRNGVSSVKGTVRLCVDTAGSVTESMLTEATGYDEYDKKLVAAVRDWRFRPYVVSGQAYAVCSTAEFVYVPR